MTAKVKKKKISIEDRLDQLEKANQQLVLEIERLEKENREIKNFEFNRQRYQQTSMVPAPTKTSSYRFKEEPWND